MKGKVTAVNRKAEIKNVTRGTVLEARIRRGLDVQKQETIVHGATCRCMVPKDCHLQVRERDSATGRATPWQTMIRATAGHSPGQRSTRSPRGRKPATRRRPNPSKADTAKARKLLKDMEFHRTKAQKAAMAAATYELKGKLEKARAYRNLETAHRAKAVKIQDEIYRFALSDSPQPQKPKAKRPKKNPLAKRKKIGRQNMVRCSICGRRVIDLWQHRWNAHRTEQLKSMEKARSAKRAKTRGKKNPCPGGRFKRP